MLSLFELQFFNLGFTRAKVSNNNDDHLSTSKYCHAILVGFKKLSSDLTRVLHVLEKKLFYFNCFFFVKELKGAILSQNHRRSQGGGGGGQGARATTIEMPPMTKICQKDFVSSFSFSIFAYNSTRVQQ